MKAEKAITQKKDGKQWITTYETEHAETIHNNLMHELIAKYLHHAGYIRRITDKTNYDGTREITVYYDNNYKTVYTVKE